jgi:alanine racemase
MTIMVMSKSYPVANIDLAALKHNLKQVKQLTPNSRVMSVIKANAYGHGIIQIAQALVDSDAFAVARLAEGIRLREAGIQHAIVLLEGVSTVEDLQTAADFSLSIVFHHQSQINSLTHAKLSKSLTFCWLMVETGMNRLGVPADNIDKALQDLTQSINISGSVGLMSHFANADCVDDRRNQQQLDRFKQCTDNRDIPISMSNSGAILSFVASHGDWVRPGLMLYGVSPFENQSANDLGLKPVMQLISVLIAIQDLQAGDQVGYGGDWMSKQAIRVGIVSIGYGDGYSRQLSNVGKVIVNNKIVAVLGRVSMDMIAIDLSKIDNVLVGDEVLLWGSDILPVEDIAQQAKTIPYELLCQVSERVKRDYHHG